MERLTKRNSMGVAVYKTPYACENCNEEFYRLSDYGNGSPTDRLAEYEEAEEQGLLHIAPLPNGTPIYLWQENDNEEWFIYKDSYLYGVSEYYHGKLGEGFFISEEECRNHSVR